MKEESGRSLIEIMGVLSIGVIMVVAAYNMYKSIEQRQKRLIATEELGDVVKNAKLLYEFSDYGRISIEKLIEDGGLTNAKTPIGQSWEIQPCNKGDGFQIKIYGLTKSECKYFKTKKPQWADSITGTTNCSGAQNNLFFEINCKPQLPTLPSHEEVTFQSQSNKEEN